MRFCSKLSSAPLCCLALVFAGDACGAGFVKQSVVAPRVRSIVKADARSGRLVRTVVVSARAAQPADATVKEIIEATARKYEVDPLLVHSVIQVESAYNPYAVSAKGAQGLMQLMPATARRFGVANPFDVEENIEAGVRYLKYLQNLFPEQPTLAIAAYNAGEAAVWKYNNAIPPYRETEQYVDRVGKKWGEAKRAAEQKAASAEPVEISESPDQRAYSVVEHFIDSEGRLHMRTVPARQPASGVETP